MRARTIYLETREDREAIRRADDAEYGPRFIKARRGDEPEEEMEPEVDPEMGPEYASVEAFAAYLLDDDRTSFTFDELNKLQTCLKRYGVLRELQAYGFHYEGRPKERSVRGFTSNSHNLYQGNPMCGGTGFEVNGVGHRY